MHIRSLFTVTLLTTLISSACSDSKKEEAAPKTPEESATAEKVAPAPAPVATKPPPAAATTHELTDIGYVIETPADWEFRTLDPAIYIFDIKPIKTAGGMTIMPSFTITTSPAGLAPSTVEAAEKRCSGKLLDKGSAANTAVFHNCETEMAGTKILKAEYFIADKESVFICSASGLDMATMNKACASMRKK